MRINLQGLSLTVDGTDVLRDVDLELTERRIGVVGANGSGKSTLLRCLNALARPTGGRVLLHPAGGSEVDPARAPQRARALVGFVFTDPDAQVVMPTPAEDVALSLRRFRLPPEERDERVRAALSGVGLASRADVSVHELSSGQRQLLAIAAVLATEPALLVLDEPTTLLDLRNTLLVRDILRGLDVPVVLASHDLSLVEDMDRVLVVDGGRVVLDGEPAATLDGYRELMGVHG